jgi:hypothetical protein
MSAAGEAAQVSAAFAPSFALDASGAITSA